MIKLKKTFFITILATLVIQNISFRNTANATKDNKGKFVIIDGHKVSYDENAINGRVDISANKINTLKDNNRSVLKENYLSVPFETQQNSYSNLSTTISMTLNSLNLENFNQEYIINLLDKENKDKVTGNDVKNILNKLTNGSKYQFRWQWKNSANDFNIIKEHITSAIDYGNPVIINTTSKLGDNYLRGNIFSNNLSYFGVVFGYSDYGNKVVYFDTGYGRFSSFKKPQVVSIKNLSCAVESGYYVW